MFKRTKTVEQIFSTVLNGDGDKCILAWINFCERDDNVRTTEDYFELFNTRIRKMGKKDRKSWLKDKLNSIGATFTKDDEGIIVANGQDLAKIVMRHGNETALNVIVLRFRDFRNKFNTMSSLENLVNTYRTT
ncbi:hypothetical protein [Trichoplusia ni ascovirus 2c]|uniref:hypothetical protein n=1 Tax=Trichoplusia ni ascovirus 2c TaxID=328615 RepID=UPI0000E441DD|nr:hypothetical protein TNAV2c_gp005 [Trichoplusia ni ascovirus 2c]ABF70522.1 hypothetical protein [Trichoplusia ni ascovirus 2c]AUS94104.1 hypothetical protein [Trichoplusia ni ascovirus 6b]